MYLPWILGPTKPKKPTFFTRITDVAASPTIQATSRCNGGPNEARAGAAEPHLVRPHPHNRQTTSTASTSHLPTLGSHPRRASLKSVHPRVRPNPPMFGRTDISTASTPLWLQVPPHSLGTINTWVRAEAKHTERKQKAKAKRCKY